MNIEAKQPAGAIIRGALSVAIAAACVAAAAQATPHGAAAAPAAAAAAPAAAAATQPGAPAAAANAVFAKVGDAVISADTYEAAFAQAARGKFYHGQPPEGEVARLQREVSQKLVDEILLEAEVKRRNIQPDAAAVQKQIDVYDERYKDSPQWKANRPRVMPGLKGKLERDSALEQLTASVKKVPAPTQEQLQKYYDQNRDKFTSPEQVHVRIILLRVEPSAPKAKWDGAREEGASIVKRLREGADFTKLAELHSEEESSKRGGDMGYLHRGMLPDSAQKAVDALKPGEVSEPVVMLEGVAVFRLEARKEPVLNSLESVRPRLQDLYMREAGEAAWTSFLEALRRSTPVQIDESRFLPLAAAAGASAPAR